MSKQLYIVGYDGSEWSKRAARCAVNFAQDSGAKIRLIYVIDWSGMRAISLEEIAHTPPERAEEERKAREDVLAPLVEQYANSNVEIESAFYWGAPAEILHDEAERHDANIIFVGRRGRSTFADMLLGSAANKLAHLSNVPVMLVP
jgi:nucleotide-binding universal stress UspA family protein